MSTTECVQSDVVSTKNETEYKEEQKDIDEHDIEEQDMLIANAMSGDKIKELLSSSGPTVKAVLLKSDGTAQEIEYDSTPSTNHVTQILGAPPSIIGQYADLDVIVVGPRYEESPEKFARNQHKLRYPFNNDTFYGDIFLYRFDQNCVVQDFTLKEYDEFAAKSNEDIGKVFKPQINDQQDLQDDEEEFDDEQEFDQEEEAQYVEDFMREVIINKVKAEFPQKFGREPTEEELEAYIAGTMKAAGALFGGAVFDQDAMDDIQEEEEEEDEDYDPTEDKEQAVKDEIEDIPNDEELECDKKDIENVEKESNLPLTDLNEEDEEKLVNSEEFENELRSAIECVQSLAKFDKQKILSMAREQYKKDTGHEPSEKMMDDAFKMFTDDQETKETFDDEQEVDEIDEVDPELFAKEMDEALANIRKLGAAHQEELVNKISGTFTELNGAEPSTEQISAIFGRIKEKLADEARDEFLENNEIDDSEDGDYKPNEEDVQQIEEDKKIELLEELVQKRNNDMNDDEDDNKKVKILVTPVKKRPSGSRMEIYLNDQPDTNKTLEMASSKFEQINGRAPTDDDKQRLKEFLTTGMLFESEIKPSMKDIDNDNDDDDDEDYTPDKDTFDYSRDIEDDLVESEQDGDENDDTSNMVDID